VSFNNLEMTYQSHLNADNEDIQYLKFSNNKEEIGELVCEVEILSKEQIDNFKKNMIKLI
ncbi:11552_t:CDS:1, partial [Funneliformis caledonium]